MGDVELEAEWPGFDCMVIGGPAGVAVAVVVVVVVVVEFPLLPGGFCQLTFPL